MIKVKHNQGLKYLQAFCIYSVFTTNLKLRLGFILEKNATTIFKARLNLKEKAESL